ncbi:MAG: hypothetical protein LBT70_03705 [Holosporaceae bacterium]|jgi:hypothetical protein|nr:hypothetical protein [Holosporaceae bacterium]
MIKFTQHDTFSKDESTNSDMGAAATPQMLIVCEDFFECDVDGFTDNATPCLWFDIGCCRLITNDSTGELSGDGRVIAQDPVVCMKYGSWAPIIQEYLYSGKNVPKIGLRRLSSINGTKVIIQEVNYEICLMKTYRQKDDTIEFTFSAITVEDINILYDNTGTKIGNTGTKFDYSTMLVTTSS